MNFLDIKTFKDLSEFLNIVPSKLGFFLYKLPRSKLYTEFEIPKKNGEKRKILAPTIFMRSIQEKIKYELEKHYVPPGCVHGFIKKRSIITNADIHTRKNWVLNIDIKDFFLMINPKRVYGLFRSKPFEFNEKIASIIANILTYKNSITQGSVTSPIISNMVCFRMDREFIRFCRSNNIAYSRYADDITFSSNDRKKLKKIYNVKLNILSEAITDIIVKNGFEVNTKKVRCNFYFNHQEVTGIKTNDFRNIKKIQKYRIRSMLKSWEKFGLNDSAKFYMEKRDLDGGANKAMEMFKNELAGLISYSNMVLGTNNLFVNKSKHRYNLLLKHNRFRVQYSQTELLENTLYSLKSCNDIGLCERESISFYCEGVFIACLHGICEEKYAEFLRVIDKEAGKTYLKRFFKTASLYRQEEITSLKDIEVIEYSLERDLVIYRVNDFFSPYQLQFSRTPIDRRENFVLARVNHTSNEFYTSTCKIDKKRMIGSSEGYPLGQTVYQGDSGSPIINARTNQVIGMVVYGLSENNTGNPNFQNGMYDLIEVWKTLIGNTM